MTPLPMMPRKKLYERDGITLYLGDCLDVLPTLGPVDHVITDPPYARDVYLRMRNDDSASGSATKIGPGLKAMRVGDIGGIDDLIAPVSQEIARLCQRWVLVFSDAESIHRWRKALTCAGLRYMRTGAWVKPDAMPQMTGDRPGVGFEPCTIAHAQGVSRWNGGGHDAVWTYFTNKGGNRPDHPCPKPLPLMRQLVEQFTDEGETILDPFCGSGTTLVAARELGRRAIGIEISEEYANVAVNILEHGVKGAAQVKRGQLPLVDMQGRGGGT